MNRRFAIGGLVSLLSGCGAQEAMPKIAKIILNPKIDVGSKEDEAKKLSLYAYTAKNVNRNFDGEPSPVVVKIFALSSDHRLFALDFFSIINDPKSALGITLVEELDESMLEPGTYALLGNYEFPKRAKKLAVVAEYLDIDTTVWRASIDIDAADSSGNFLLYVSRDKLQFTRGEKPE